MNGINSYHQNINHFQSMMKGLSRIGKSNCVLLPIMLIGNGNFANIQKKQKFSRGYIDLKIEKKIPLTAQEKQLYCNQVIRKQLNNGEDEIDDILESINKMGGGDED
jgi:hypothetical protein